MQYKSPMDLGKMAVVNANTPALLRVVASSVAIARRSGTIIRGILKGGDLGIVDKNEHEPGKFDPQTEADRAAQRMIVGSLTTQFPGLKVIGEEIPRNKRGSSSQSVYYDRALVVMNPIKEDCNTADESSLVLNMDEEVLKHKCPDDLSKLNIEDLIVWVDPLDGTAEFTEGNIDHVTVLIGISALGKSVAGVIHQPFFQYQQDPNSTGRTVWGVVGLNAFGVTKADIAPGRRIVTTTKSHGNKSVLDAVQAVNPDKIIRTGGAGYKVLQVIEGVADAYVFASPGCKKWDTCAPESVLRALGGTLTDIHGKNIAYDCLSEFRNLTGVLATRVDHQSYVSKIPDNVKQQLSN